MLNSTCPWSVEQFDDHTIDSEPADEADELHEKVWVTVVLVNSYDFCGEVFEDFVTFCICKIEDSLPIERCKVAHVW